MTLLKILESLQYDAEETVRGHNRELLKTDIKGIIQLDYMDLYKSLLTRSKNLID